MMQVFQELAAGGFSCAVASAILNPCDVTKVRLQTQNQPGGQSMPMYNNLRHCAQRILAEEGIAGLWLPGMGASMLREITYSSVRVGLYPTIRGLVAGETDKPITLSTKIAAGLLTGAIGSAAANPTDLVKIRMQVESGKIVDGVYTTGLHKGMKPSYNNTIDAFRKIYRGEGIRGLYRGVVPTTTRAAMLTSAQLSSYDHSKYMLKQSGWTEGPLLHVVCSLISAVCATTAAAPADFIKTRIMNDREGVIHGQSRLYKGPLDCLVKSVSHDGPLVLFRGWLPSFYRLAPHFIISLPLMEFSRKLMGLSSF